MKIAYIGDFINHGKSLAPTGTSIVFLLSTFQEVESIDVYCPIENEHVEEVTVPPKIRLIEAYKYDSVYSLLNLLKLHNSHYDKVLFNILSTAFGNSSVSNAFGISIPIILVKLFGMDNIEVIYHNSVFTNDIEKLGYTGIYDKIRGRALGKIEKELFKTVSTFVLLHVYKDRIDRSIGKNKVRFLNVRYLEAMATTFLNDGDNKQELEINTSNRIPVILLHGNWGPQKNIDLAIDSLEKIKTEGLDFKLRISGGINHHFPEYEKHFMNVLERHGFGSNYSGFVDEKDILDLFLTSDLLLLPYNTPGGHSAVLEQAIFFEIPTVAIDFPEYREQADGVGFVTLCSREEFHSIVKEVLSKLETRENLEIQPKIIEVTNNIKRLI